MEDNHIRIEPRGAAFAVVLEHDGMRQVMDVRDSFQDAEALASYVARLIKSEVVYSGK
jgi:hypothetical protein